VVIGAYVDPEGPPLMQNQLPAPVTIGGNAEGTTPGPDWLEEVIRIGPPVDISENKLE
jgi:hypothetical protein